MRFNFETFIEPNYIWVSRPLEDVIFLPHLLQRALILHESFVDRLESYELTRQPVDGQIYLSKRALANNLSYFIVINFGLKNVSLDI